MQVYHGLEEDGSDCVNHKTKKMKQTIQLASLLLAITTASTFIACKKDNKDDNAGKTKTELITTGSWKVTAYTVNPALDVDGDGDVETNVFDYYEACEKDDFTTFKTDNTAEFNDGPSKCDPGDAQTYSRTWYFTANETKLVVDGQEFTIIELSATSAKIRYTYELNGVTYTDEITYGH